MQTTKVRRAGVLAGIVCGLAFAWTAAGGSIVASNALSVGYGFIAGGWTTNETQSANTPTTAPNPGFAEFPVGDFLFRFCAGGTFCGSSGPTFVNRVLGSSGSQCCYIEPSGNNKFVVTAIYTGTNRAYANNIHLDIDQLSIYALAYPSITTTNECWWEETTQWHTSRSPSTWLTWSTAYTDATKYQQVFWNPPDFAVQDGFSVTRTFLIPANKQFVDGLELVCRAWIETRTTPRDPMVPLASSSRFSVGYGYSGAWRTNETASANTPTTAPNPGNNFAMGDFLINVSVAGPGNYASVGPGFDNRLLTASGSVNSWSTNMTVTLSAVYTGTLANARTSLRLSIDQISIYAGTIPAGGGSVTNARWIETTSGNAATSAPIATLAGGYLFGAGWGRPHYYSQLSWNPGDPLLTGGTNMTRTFAFPEWPTFAVDGLEVVGSAELLGPPAGTLVLLR